MRKIGIAIIFVSVFFGCAKDNLDLDYKIHKLPIADEARCLYLFGDTVLIGGGKINGTGFLLGAPAALGEFKVLCKGMEKAVYAIGRHNERWYFGLDSAQLIYSDDLKQFHQYWWKEQDWVNDLNKQPFRRFSSAKGAFVAVCGGELTFGVIYTSLDSGSTWDPLEFEHDLRALCAVPEGSDYHFWAAGNGLLMKMSTSDHRWKTVELRHKFIADMVFKNIEKGLAITYNGELMTTEKGGDTWKTQQHEKMNLFVNRMYFDGLVAIAVCNNGWIGLGSIDGNDWRWWQLDEKLDLYDVITIGNKVVIAAEAGNLVEFALP